MTTRLALIGCGNISHRAGFDSKRVLVAGLRHETHTFVKGRTTLSDFSARHGAEIVAAEGDASPLAGALEVARKCEWQVVPALHLDATPGGLVADDVIGAFWQATEDAIKNAPGGASGLDGVWLDLHGAMVSESYQDVEGEMLQRLRERLGPDIPIAGSLDLHGNITPRMAQCSNALVAYRENPHTDVKATGARSARLLHRLMTTGERAVTVYAAPPIIWPPTGVGTADSPMRDLEAQARAIEKAHPEILAVNVFAGYAFADTPHTGVSFTAVTTGDPAQAQAALAGLCELAWTRREQGDPPRIPLDAAMQRLAELLADSDAQGTASPEDALQNQNSKIRIPSGPVLLVEPADNIGGGAPGDLTFVLRALLEQGVENAAVCINDPETVRQLASVPLGESRHVVMGGKSGEIGAESIALDVEMISRSGGEYTLEDPHSHAAASGLHHRMGPCAVIRYGGITILLTSRKTAPLDLAQWRSQGIAPETLAVIGVKAAVAHRQAYRPIAAASLILDTPGPCAENLRRLPFQNVRRPIFPMDAFPSDKEPSSP